MSDLYHHGSRALQDRHDTRRLADRLEQVMVHDRFTADDRAFLETYPEAQFVVRVEARRVYPNCPRHIHRLRLVERSSFVPRARRATPVPAWTRSDWACDVLPAGDPARGPAPPTA